MADAAAPPKKKKEKVSPIPGLELIKAETLHLDFKKFRHDDLFFITHCIFYPPKAEPLPRIVALTPQAIFICDPNGKMDRATRLEQLTSMLWQVQMSKRLIGNEELTHFCVRIPSEFDIHFSIKKDKKKPDENMDFIRVIQAICNFKNEGKFTSEQVAPEKKIQDLVKTERPEGFLSPQEILLQNKQRQQVIDLTESATKEALAMKEEAEILKKEAAQREATLAQLDRATGADMSDFRKRKDELHAEHVRTHKEHTTLSIEVAKLEAELVSLREKLKEESSNFDALVQEGIEAAGSDQSVKQNELHNLRKKAQTRELNAAKAKFEDMKSKAAVIPQYEGNETMAARAQKEEQEVAAAIAKLEREFTNTDKMTKYFETMNAELERNANRVAELNGEKNDLLDAREAHQKKKAEEAAAKTAASAKPAAAVDDLGLDDDDLLGGDSPSASPAKPAAAPSGGDDLLDDDDLLGGDSTPTKPAPPPATGGGDDLLDDDDLLGDGGGAPAPAAAAAAPPAASKPPDEDDDLI